MAQIAKEVGVQTVALSFGESLWRGVAWLCIASYWFDLFAVDDGTSSFETSRCLLSRWAPVVTNGTNVE